MHSFITVKLHRPSHEGPFKVPLAHASSKQSDGLKPLLFKMKQFTGKSCFYTELFSQS